MKFSLINLLLFKLGWAAAVFSATYGEAWIGAATIAAIAAINLAMAAQPRRELLLLIAAATVGLIWESVLTAQGVLIYAQSPSVPVAPYWIVAMWILLATTLNVSMRWMKKSPWLALLFGAIGGPLSFIAGEKIGAVVFPQPTLAIVVISIGWAVLVPAMLRIADIFNGHTTAALEPAVTGGQA
ncbi:MAG: DUF2878 domain-containing protein [Pseudomonadota bacterium]